MNDISKSILIGVATTVILGAIGSINGSWIIKALGGVTEKELAVLQTELDRAHKRLNGISLVASHEATGEFNCGNSDKADQTSLVVMYGSQDGTSCGVINQNYYKKLVLEVPKK
ncbi:hypothetical protein J7384_08730 [Endozoicomonas sp. G2_1]|uniref:hypothetical protein n=1 Tax=Endozoicomonas sp. G2_1 TaxID=2821091 RepID=UPI001ADA3586|nr:hypothetical protein [Endozoicomonas sp. G2_1]MBO9490445.1 hypothetical protein [Endozoicomonas sp. G2_1]